MHAPEISMSTRTSPGAWNSAALAALDASATSASTSRPAHESTLQRAARTSARPPAMTTCTRSHPARQGRGRVPVGLRGRVDEPPTPRAEERLRPEDAPRWPKSRTAREGVAGRSHKKLPLSTYGAACGGGRSHSSPRFQVRVQRANPLVRNSPLPPVIQLGVELSGVWNGALWYSVNRSFVLDCANWVDMNEPDCDVTGVSAGETYGRRRAVSGPRGN